METKFETKEAARFLRTLQVDGSEVHGERLTEGGHLEISAALPALVSVTEQIAEARYPNFKGIMSAKKKPVETLTLAALGIPSGDAGGANAWSVVETVLARTGVTCRICFRDRRSAAWGRDAGIGAPR